MTNKITYMWAVKACVLDKLTGESVESITKMSTRNKARQFKKGLLMQNSVYPEQIKVTSSIHKMMEAENSVNTVALVYNKVEY